MEKKTIGSFIAALRKANGMTQKELAEKLNVSDKTVSRWEREEGVPDLSAVPVIAEIFGVSCDELLTGARKPADERHEMSASDNLTQKSEKQRKRLLTVSLSNYKTQCYLAMGCSFIGLIAAMICNFGFLRAYIGFFVATIFYLVSAVFQTIMINRTFLIVSDENLDELETGIFRWNVLKLAEWSYGLTIGLFGFVLPLVVFTRNSAAGLNADYWFVYGVIFATIAVLIFTGSCYYLNAALLKKDTYKLSAWEERIYYHNHKLKFKTIAVTIVVLVITLFLHALGVEILWSPSMLSRGTTTFHDYESFVAYMETPIPYEAALSNGYGQNAVSVIPNSTTDNAWPVIEEETHTYTLEDVNGETVCTYIKRNETVFSVRYEPKEGTILPITVITHQEYRIARNISEIISIAYCILYPIEIVAALLFYYRKRAK